MLKLFAIKNSCFDDDKRYEKYLALVDCARREKIRRLSVREKRNQSLAAGVIVPLALERLGFIGGVEIAYGEHGKPRLIQPEGLFFNLSHSGEWTVAAFSDCEVGVDIQQIKPADMRLADRFFAAEEREAIAQSDGAQELFFRLWTVKESYLKATGAGLSRPLNSFTVRFKGGGASIDDPLVSKHWYAVEVNAPAGYKIACCTALPQPVPNPEIINL
ncbi:MAG: 4'-phosphopantetheinyl transferase superfamily protein [Clostridia bacterium]|nr:4'-phosphopantetheinyl transferase superfamily protein [Clostridia bacterium]